ncbi:MAG: type II CAAX endopeptidase family protein [Cyanobacteria bacterium P01_D01_bin.36]
MTLKRIVLSAMTLLVVWVMSMSLISSFGEPQVGNRLQLYQTDLMVQASEWNGSGLPEAEVEQFRRAVFGKDALESAVEQYRSVRSDAATGVERIKLQIDSLLGQDDQPSQAQRQSLAATARAQQSLVDQIDLRLGMVQTQQNETEKAVTTWQKLAEGPGAIAPTAATLADLWRNPPIIRPETATTIDTQLKGWFRYIALNRLYTLENKTEQLNQLQVSEVSTAESTLLQLSVVGILPSFGGLLGSALLIALVGQRVLRGKNSLLAIEEGTWEVPWNWEDIWLVIVGGFLFTGQIALPLILQVGMLAVQSFQTGALETASIMPTGLADTGLAATGFIIGLSSRGKALYSLVFYLLMAASTLGVLYFTVKSYLPLSKEWFRINLSDRWPLWGLGGYLVALPLMLGVSLLNQQIWQGQGGNNPILQIVLEERDTVALGMFLFTAAVAAPIFEEILFRGFLLPSLTRYMPTWGAIGLSSLIFSVAHLSFSEVLPLTVLGAILGFVYARSRNLAASILLHSTWNSVTMIGLFLLGSGQ